MWASALASPCSRSQNVRSRSRTRTCHRVGNSYAAHRTASPGMEGPAGIEPATRGLTDRRSTTRVSTELRTHGVRTGNRTRTVPIDKLDRTDLCSLDIELVIGLEPMSSGLQDRRNAIIPHQHSVETRGFEPRFDDSECECTLPNASRAAAPCLSCVDSAIAAPGVYQLTTFPKPYHVRIRWKDSNPPTPSLQRRGSMPYT